MLLKSTLNLERKTMKNIANMLEKFDDNLEKRAYMWLQGWCDVNEGQNRNSIQVIIPESVIPDVYIK